MWTAGLWPGVTSSRYTAKEGIEAENLTFEQPRYRAAQFHRWASKGGFCEPNNDPNHKHDHRICQLGNNSQLLANSLAKGQSIIPIVSEAN